MAPDATGMCSLLERTVNDALEAAKSQLLLDTGEHEHSSYISTALSSVFSRLGVGLKVLQDIRQHSLKAPGAMQALS